MRKVIMVNHNTDDEVQKVLNKVDDVENRVAPGICRSSDNVLATLVNTEHSTTSESYVSISDTIMVCNFSGTLRATVSGKMSAANVNGYCGVIVEHPDGTTTEVSCSIMSKTSYTTISKDFAVNHGDRIHACFRTLNDNYTAYCNLVTVCGDINIPPSDIGIVSV